MDIHELNAKLFQIALRTLERIRYRAFNEADKERFEDAYNTLKQLSGENRSVQ